MSNQYFLKREANVFGPYSLSQIIASAKNGRLKKKDLLGPADTGPWYLAAELPLLKPILSDSPSMKTANKEAFFRREILEYQPLPTSPGFREETVAHADTPTNDLCPIIFRFNNGKITTQVHKNELPASFCCCCRCKDVFLIMKECANCGSLVQRSHLTPTKCPECKNEWTCIKCPKCSASNNISRMEFFFDNGTAATDAHRAQTLRDFGLLSLGGLVLTMLVLGFAKFFVEAVFFGDDYLFFGLVSMLACVVIVGPLIAAWVLSSTCLERGNV